MTDMRRILAKREADRIATEVIERARRTVNKSQVVQRPVCLVTSYRPRDAVPAGTLLVSMTPKVVARLAAMGPRQPVSLIPLSRTWWAVNVDKCSLDPIIECGAGFSGIVASSEQVMGHYAFAYCQMTDGPYLSRDEVPIPQQ